MNKLIGIVLLVLLPFACLAQNVVSTGPDTYIVISQPTFGRSSGQKEKVKALKKANRYCVKLGKRMQQINSKETDPGFNRSAAAEVEFRCIKPEDPALQRQAPTGK
jgi:hypothetical protein